MVSFDMVCVVSKIFDGKKVGVNGLRHSVLTDKFGDTIAKKKSC